MRRMLDEENLLFKAAAQAPLTAQEVANYLNEQEIQVTAKGSFETYEEDPDITYFTDNADYEKHTTVYPLYLSFYNSEFYVSGNLPITLQFPDTIEDDEALEEYVTEGFGRFTLLAIGDFEEDDGGIDVRLGAWFVDTPADWEIIPDFKVGDTLTIPEEEEGYTCLIHGKVVEQIDEPSTYGFGYIDSQHRPYADNLQINNGLYVRAIEPLPGDSVTTITNLKVRQNVNVDGWIAGKEQTWTGYSITENITGGNTYNMTSGARFGNGQKGELKVLARVDDSGALIVVDFEFNQTAVNDQDVQFTYPIRYYDADEEWHWGYLTIGGKLVSSDKMPHLYAQIIGDNGTALSLVPIDDADYTESTYGIKMDVLPH